MASEECGDETAVRDGSVPGEIKKLSKWLVAFIEGDLRCGERLRANAASEWPFGGSELDVQAVLLRKAEVSEGFVRE